jgi:hypothetical protein
MRMTYSRPLVFPSFSNDPLPLDVTPLEPLNPLGHQFVGKYIYYQGVELIPLSQGMATNSQFGGLL